MKVMRSGVVGFGHNDVEALAQGIDDLADEDLGRRGAGGEAHCARPAEPVPVDVGGALDEARSTPSRSATSARRSELLLLGAPITSMRSQDAAIALTAAWRLVVA